MQRQQNRLQHRAPSWSSQMPSCKPCRPAPHTTCHTNAKTSLEQTPGPRATPLTRMAPYAHAHATAQRTKSLHSEDQPRTTTATLLPALFFLPRAAPGCTSAYVHVAISFCTDKQQPTTLACTSPSLVFPMQCQLVVTVCQQPTAT